MSTALVWSLFSLAKEQSVQAELHAALTRHSSDASAAQDPLMHKFVDEVLRLFPSIWLLSRRTTEDIVLDSRALKKDTVVLHFPLHLQRNAAHFEQPHRFSLHRKTPDRFAYAPFGAGVRKCLGDRFARAEISLVVANLVRRFHLSTTLNQVPLAPTITLRPGCPIPLTFEKRTP